MFNQSPLILEIQKSFGAFTLDLSLSLNLAEGVNALFGRNGSGKSTTLDCIAGLIEPDRGRIKMGDSVLFASGAKVNVPAYQRGVRYVFQNNLLFPHMTVWQNIVYGLRGSYSSPPGLDPGTLVDLLDLRHLVERRPDSLSGGEAQRVAIARAVAACPRLLLLDEPLAALDSASRGRILRFFKTLQNSHGIPMIYVSHSLSEIIYLTDQVFVLDGGKVVVSGSGGRLMSNDFVIDALDGESIENFVEAELFRDSDSSGLTRACANGFELWISEVGSYPSGPVLLTFRASDILLSTEVPVSLSARNIIRGTVTKVLDQKHNVVVAIDLGTQLLAEISRAASTALGIKPGREVFLIIKSNSIKVLG
jgi:molybdate transport system ATP-binding protein